MKRLDVLLTNDALLDLQGIYVWIATVGDGPITAERYTSRIENRCDAIGDLPFGGRSRDDILPGLRVVTFERRVTIAYRVMDDHVRVLNIFGAGRDYEAFYLDDDEQG